MKVRCIDTKILDTIKSSRLVKDVRGAMDIPGSIIAFGIAAIALLIIILIFYSVQVALPTTQLSAAGQTAISNVVTTAGNAWTLIVLVLIVFAAALILGVLMILRR